MEVVRRRSSLLRRVEYGVHWLAGSPIYGPSMYDPAFPSETVYYLRRGLETARLVKVIPAEALGDVETSD